MLIFASGGTGGITGAMKIFNKQKGNPMEFPNIRPNGANYIRPREGEAMDITPPGFSWWRGAERGACQYRLVVMRDGKDRYTSPLTPDPIHVPDVVFPPGAYTWRVEAVSENGSVGAVSQTRAFSVNEGAPEQPWVNPRILLGRVPSAHPRIFFLSSQLDAVRKTLTTTRAEAFAGLKRMADEGLSIEPIPEPDYDQIKDPAQRRLAYFDGFHETRKVHDTSMRALALMYMLTGERKYGDHAKALIVDAAGWDPEGISSIMAPYGDEVGLGLLRAGAEVYDWLCDLFSDDERARVAKMVGARADQMIRQLEKSDYTFKPEGSHNGRLPGFLLEHAVALAEDPRAGDWAGYALKVIGTNFPHWAGQDGGWAQGVPYGMSYNSRDAMPFHAWHRATGHNIWLKPFYQKLPWFFYYAVSPLGEIMPFGDTEHSPVRPSTARTFLFYHGVRLGAPRLCRWADQVEGGVPVEPFPGILVENKPDDAPEEPIPNDRVFRGIGWGALHSEIGNPKEDFMVMFRSSPYGGVSHGHASQNDFAVMKGGQALICAGGLRFPHHGTPFHTQYAQQSISHNCILVNGQGAINRDGNRGGEIAGFSTGKKLGYVCGEAENAYGDLLDKCRRHLLLIRPSVLILMDDLVAPEPSTFQWLLHAFEKFEIDADRRIVTSRRKGASLAGQLYASTALTLSQTDAWLVAPDEGYPTLSRPLPEKRWHFTAQTERTDRIRIASIFSVQGPGEAPPDVRVSAKGNRIAFEYGSDVAGHIDLSPDSRSIIQVTCGAESLKVEA